MLSNKKVLVIAAHPDDEVLGCGGTINRFIKEGKNVRILILGEGITSRQESRNLSAVKKQIEKLHRDMKKSAHILGVKNIQVLSFPDNRFDSVDLLDIIKSIESVKREFKPDIIFTHQQNDLNIDHRITFNAVMTACRPLKNETVKEIYSFEVASSTEWQNPNTCLGFKPIQYFILDKKNINAKIKAMEAYTTERKKYPHPRSKESIMVQAKYRGICISTDFAEAFEVIRGIK
jgi:LmbE family N-acetylglucosaminyl deacetylase